jgi:peptide/nickel transport system substrate-binding protein
MNHWTNRHFYRALLSLVLASVLVLSLVGCGTLTLDEEDVAAIQEEEPTVILGQSIGQELVATYAADHVFSLNSVSTASFNPYETTSAWNMVVGMLVYETLVTTDSSFAVSPNLVTSWQTEDGIHWTFSVDTTRLFHDGGTMTAADAVYSIQQAMAYGSRYATRFRNVQGISAVDTETFAVTLSQANYRFYELLNVPCIEYGTAYSDTPPGTGPYRFSESGTYLTLDKNHPLASQMPLETVHLKEYSAAEDILQAFEDSYIDLVINDPTGMASLGYSSTNIAKYVNTSNLHYIGYNMNSQVFGTAMLRSLITYAIDRATIVSDSLKGAAVAATVPVHPDSDLYPEALASSLGYSASSLQTAMDNLGLVDVDGDGQVEFGGQMYTISFVVCSDSAAKVSAARSIASKLREFGFGIDLRELSYEDYVAALEDGDFDMYYGEVKLCGDWDLSLLLGSGESLNYGGVQDATLDGYLQSALASTEEEQETSLTLLYEYIAQTAPITPICFEKSQVLYHRGVIAGLNPTQDNIFYGMEDWTLDLE